MTEVSGTELVTIKMEKEEEYLNEFKFSTTELKYFADTQSKCVKDLACMLSGYRLEKSLKILGLKKDDFLFWKSHMHIQATELFSPKFSLFVDQTFTLGRLPVVTAILLKDHEKIREYKEVFEDMTFKDFEGNTPLHIACRDGFEKEALILMEGIESHNEVGAQSDILDQTKLLKLKSGRTCLLSLESNHDGNTPLHLSCSCKGQEHLIETLLIWRSSLVFTKNSKKEYPLQIAYNNGFFEYFNVLLWNKWNKCTILDYQDKRPQLSHFPYSSPSQESVFENYLQTAKILLHDVNLGNKLPLVFDLMFKDVFKDEKGLLPIETWFDNFISFHDHSSWYRTFPLKISDSQINRILETGLRDTMVRNYTQLGYAAVNLNLSDIDGMLRACSENVTVTQCIHNRILWHTNSYGVNAVNNEGRTPLEEAHDVGHYVACAWLMVRKHCSVYLNTLQTSNERCEAVKRICKETLQSFPADSKVESIVPGDTLLHVAASMTNAAELIQFLIVEMNFDVNIINSRQENPLHVAIRKNHVTDVFKLFLNCDLQQQNIDGDTPLNLLFYHHYYEHAIDMATTLYQDARIKIDDINIEQWSKHFERNIYLGRNSPLHLVTKVSGDVGKLKKKVDSECFLKWRRWRNTLGELPLHLAASNRDLNNLKLVIDANNCNCVTNKGNSAVHELCIYSTNLETDLQILRFLHEDLHCNTHIANCDGQTALHISCRRGHLKLVAYLLEVAKLDPNAKDKDGADPLKLTPLGQSEIVRILIQHGADTNSLYREYKTFFKTYSSEKPPPTPLNVIVIGNHSSGKSTLVKAMKEENSTLNIVEAEPHTAGIIPSFYQSQTFGTVMWYDLAGHSEYYASHEAVLNTVMTSSTPLVFLLVDIRKPQEIINQEILYWFHFLQGVMGTREFSMKPHIIVVFSFLDELEVSTQEKIAFTRKILTPFIIKLKVEIKAFIALDCRDPGSDNIKRLRSLVEDSYLSLCDKTQLDFLLHCFYAFLVGNFKNEAAVTMQRVLELTEEWIATGIDPHYEGDVEEEDSDESVHSFDPEFEPDFEEECPAKLLPKDHKHIFDMCKRLSSKGHVMVIQDSLKNSDYSWIVINKVILLNEVNGSLFAPENFKLHYKVISSSTGVVTLSKLSEMFPKYNNILLSQFLTYLEFCIEISDENVLQLLCLETKSSFDRYFFFPGLVSTNKPTYAWSNNNMSCKKCGWILQVTEPNAFFTPRFIQVLLLRLAFSYPLSTKKRSTGLPSLTIKRQCSFWKTGLFWRMELGLDCLIEITENSQALVLMLRSTEEELSERYMISFVQYRSSLITKILATVDELCSSLFLEESFLHPDHVMYPPIKCEEAALYSVTSIAKAVCEQLPYCTSTEYPPIKLTDLLIFEPFVLSNNCYLFNKSLCSEAVSHKDFQQCTSKICSKSPTLYSECCKLRDSKKITYGDLRMLLGKYSIFGERDPQALGNCKTDPLYIFAGFSGFLKDEPTLPKLISFECEDGEKINILEEIGVEYSNFGILILNDIRGKKMSAIEHKNMRDPHLIVPEIMRLWLQGEGKPVSWQTLVEVLDCIKLSLLATKIRQMLQ